MKTRTILSYTFCFLLLLSSNQTDAKTSSCLQTIQALQDQIPHKTITSFTLANGLKVFLQTIPESGHFTLRTVVKVGGVNEKASESGYAHLFEHMMFKGSEKIKDGIFFNAIRSVGGKTNATTTYDQTAYYSQMPKNYLRRTLFLESDRLQNIVLSNEKLRNQIQAVLEEKKLRLDNVPYVGTVSNFMVQEWEDTPYGHLLIGDDKTLKNADIDAIRAFFKRYYQPQNTTLTVVGDIDINHAQTLIKEYFSDWEQHTKLAQAETTKPVKTIAKDVSLHDPLAPYPLYGIVWHTVGLRNPDYLSLSLLTEILITSEASRLKKGLKYKNKQVFETIGAPVNFKDIGLVGMAFVPRTATSFSELKKAVAAELGDIQQNGPKPMELCRVIKRRQLALLKQLSTNYGRAVAIGDADQMFSDPYYYFSLLDKLTRVTTNDIQNVANRYLYDGWVAIEVTASWYVQVAKWLLERLPKSISHSLENHFL